MIKKTIRWILYSILIGTVLCSCIDDELDTFSPDLETPHVHTDQYGRTIETVAAKEVSFILDHISAQRAGYLAASGNRTQDEGANPFGTVNVDHILALINDEAATDKTYTFGMNNPEGIIDEFANLIIRTIDGEIVKAYIQVYSPTPSYLEAHGLALGSGFSGTISSYFLEGSGIDLERMQGMQKLGEGLDPVKLRTVEFGESVDLQIFIDCDPPDTASDDDTDPNGDDTGGTTGSGSGDPGDPNDGGHTDTGTTDTNPGGDEGGAGTDGGGAQDCDFEVYTNCCNRGFCDPHGPRPPAPHCTGTNAVVIDCGSDRSATTSGDKSTSGDSISCPNEDVIVIDPNDEDDCDTSKEDLKKIFPNANDTDMQTLANVINHYGEDFDINSDEALWHFLSQAGHETGGFGSLQVTENLNYSTASLIPKTYPSKFTLDTIAASDKLYAGDYTGDAEALANVVYCCKYGNGDEDSGDGWKYRGRGIFQLTWKDNYSSFKTWYNDEYDPDIDPVTTPNIISNNDTLAILSGLWYYKTRVSDKITIDSTAAVKDVTEKINGKLKKGLKDRKERFQKAKDSITCQ